MADDVPDPCDIALGEAVRMRRRTIGMSQEALAQACGVRFQQIQKYESGKNRISFSRLVQVSSALNCRAADLIEMLDLPGDAAGKPLDLAKCMRTPGAADLLAAFEDVSADARVALLKLVESLAKGSARLGA